MSDTLNTVKLFDSNIDFSKLDTAYSKEGNTPIYESKSDIVMSFSDLDDKYLRDVIFDNMIKYSQSMKEFDIAPLFDDETFELISLDNELNLAKLKNVFRKTFNSDNVFVFDNDEDALFKFIFLARNPVKEINVNSTGIVGVESLDIVVLVNTAHLFAMLRSNEDRRDIINKNFNTALWAAIVRDNYRMSIEYQMDAIINFLSENNNISLSDVYSNKVTIDMFGDYEGKITDNELMYRLIDAKALSVSDFMKVCRLSSKAIAMILHLLKVSDNVDPSTIIIDPEHSTLNSLIVLAMWRTVITFAVLVVQNNKKYLMFREFLNKDVRQYLNNLMWLSTNSNELRKFASAIYNEYNKLSEFVMEKFGNPLVSTTEKVNAALNLLTKKIVPEKE